MNAVISANTLDWRASSAFNDNLRLDCLEPDVVRRFNGRATFDTTFKETLQDDFAGTLERFGIRGIDASELDPGWTDRLALNDEEYDSVNDLVKAISGRGIQGNLALERETSAMGIGVPAIAILIVVVVVVVAFYAQR